MKPGKNIYKLLSYFIKAISILNMIFLICPLAYGAVITVGPSGNYQKIQDAINASLDGDEIIVSQGKYIENIKFNVKNIILRSIDPTDTNTVAMTIIDGNKADSVVTFSGTELTTCVLSGFTITNGKANYGGGIYGGNSSQKTLATIQNNTITENSAYSGSGGGLYYCDGTILNNTITGNFASGSGGGLYYCNGTILNNTIIGNSAYYSGGGLANCDGTIQNNTITGNSTAFAPYSGGGLYHCDGTIQNNTITGNSAAYGGGGLFYCNGTIQNNTITENSAHRGGGLFYCNGIIQNNTITGNFADEYGGGLYYCDGKIQNNTITGNSTDNSGGGLSICNGTIENCIIWGNSGGQLYSSSIPSYSCIQDWGGVGTGNINSDPQFVDSTTNNYHLKSSSPCIDAGCLIAGLTQDFEGNPRPYNGTTKPRGDGSDYDIGAYEYNICTLNYQDINDYILGKTSPPPEIIQQMDVNNDSKVDIADVVYFILHKK